LARNSEDYDVVEYLCDVVFYGVLGAVWCFHNQMVEYDDEVWSTCDAYVLYTLQHEAILIKLLKLIKYS
jgi:hypothetical protein